MKLSLEKILTVSAKEYCCIVGKKLKDYSAVGVMHDSPFGYYKIKGEEKKEMTVEAPERTEVIVNYHMLYNGYCIGTALIPKKKRRHQ